MLKGKRVLVVGDYALDKYHWGYCRDFNPEAPVPILDLVYEETVPGMAGNVERNLTAFGCDVYACYGHKTSVKTRFMDLKTKRCLLRADVDMKSDPVDKTILADDLSDYDAIVISDYNKGSVTVDTVQHIVANAKCRIFMDTKMRDLEKLKGVTLKINRREWESRISDHDDTVVTLGEDGVMYGDIIKPAADIDVHDVCGAGDTFLAGLVAGWLAWGYMDRALELGLRASAIAVKHAGTYSLDRGDVEDICDYL